MRRGLKVPLLNLSFQFSSVTRRFLLWSKQFLGVYLNIDEFWNLRESQLLVIFKLYVCVLLDIIYFVFDQLHAMFENCMDWCYINDNETHFFLSYLIVIAVQLIDVILLSTEKLFQYPCEWNYRPDHCMYMSNCRSAEERGVSIVHGNRGVYHNDKQLAFRAIYNAIRDVSKQA